LGGEAHKSPSFLAFVRLCAPLWLILACFLAFAEAKADDTPDREPDPALRAALIEAVGASDSFEHRFDAEVWLTDMSTRLAPLVPDVDRRLSLLRLIHREAKRANLPPELVLALIQVESAFKRYAVSWAGARGLMQVMPFWKAEIGRPDDNLFDPATNLRYGCTILRYYLDQADGDLTEALAAYNGSRGEIWYPTRVQAALEARWYRR